MLDEGAIAEPKQGLIAVHSPAFASCLDESGYSHLDWPCKVYSNEE